MSGRRDGATRTARYVPISAPKPYEGVGRALASAYSATEQTDLPQDMLRLLDQLDRSTGNEGGNPAHD